MNHQELIPIVPKRGIARGTSYAPVKFVGEDWRPSRDDQPMLLAVANNTGTIGRLRDPEDRPLLTYGSNHQHIILHFDWPSIPSQTYRINIRNGHISRKELLKQVGQKFDEFLRGSGLGNSRMLTVTLPSSNGSSELQIITWTSAYIYQIYHCADDIWEADIRVNPAVVLERVH
ncbi:hypothetical protein CPC08DRAFT_802490 [Agrocybe pediades]|nr:hypothetical protein CPC08DRAFT_802490 [Agrocybe pediades]